MNVSSKKGLLTSIVMPAFNESEGIVSFLREISEAFADLRYQIIVIDDFSEDETMATIKSVADRGLPVHVYRNEKNLGHGPSTIRALTEGIASSATVIVAVDGDGQFLGKDIRLVYDALINSRVNVVEGAREGRNGPAYRRIVSALTQFLVWLKSGSWPKDANTPLRAYDVKTLSYLLSVLPQDALTPNLFISALTRTIPIPFQVCTVESIDRRGSVTEGSSWKSRFRNLPSKRFRKFVLEATSQWIKFGLLGGPGAGLRPTRRVD